MRRSIALLLVAAALTQAAEIDPCDRQPFRGRCPNANGAQTRSQFVLRYYMRNNECVSYPYGHCANDASEPELYRYKEECEQACLAPGNLGERIPFGDSFETYGTVGPLDKAAVNPSTRSPVTETPLPTTAAPTTRGTPSTTAVHSTTVRSTTPSTTTTTETARTECERRRALASSSLIKGGFVPECDRNGNFARTQCEPDARQCFCVDEDGIEVSNSRTRDGSTPDCDGIIRASPPRTNECVGIPETGPCSSNLVRWHYDEEALECKTFAYSGCGGNGNNYETEEACRDRCVPVSVECPRGLPLRSTQGYYVNCAKQSCPAGYECHTIGAQAICCEQEKKSEVDNLHSGVAAGDICAMPKERGPCDKYELRFFFNAETKECKYFFFGGCEGNGNNFARVEDCEQRCGVKKAPSTVQTAPPTTLPPTTTPLRTQPTTRPTTRQTTRAQPAVPNPSDFGPEVPDFSEDASAETEAFVPVTESSRPLGATRDMAEGNRCAHPLDMGNCQGHFVRWFWNEQKANCEVFTYTGCQGNGNNFASREECLSICNGEALARGGIIPTAAAVMNVCKHDVDAGECNGVFQRFAFESEAGECRPFTYGGCGGNGNNFATMVECKQRCQQDTVSGDVCTSTVDSGECSGLFQRFAFDRAMGDCRPFNYGGCGGNGNNFASLGECRTQCNHALAPGCPARPACDFQRCQMLLDIRGCPICSCPPHDGVVPPVAQCPPVDPSRCVEPCTTFTNRLGCTECSCPREGESAQPPPSVPVPQSTSPSTTASPPTSARPTSPRASPPAPHHHFSPSPPAASSAPSPPSAPSAPAPSRGHVRQEAVTTHDTQDKPLPPPSHSSPSKTSPLPSPTHKPVSLPDALGEKCMQPLDAGPCDRFIERFYFDAKDGRCHSFRYGGCAGNRNHFFTQKECEIHCARFSNFLSEADPTLAMISRRLSENADQSLPFMETPGTVHTTLPLPSPTTVLPQRGQGGGAASLPPTFKPIPMEEILQWAMEHEGPEATANPKGTKVAKAVAPTRTAPVTTTTHSVPTTTRAVPTTVRTVPTTARPVPTHPTTVKIAPHTVVETHRHEGKTRVEQSVDEPVKKVVPIPIEGVIRVPNPPRVIVPQDQTLPKEVFDRFIHDVDTFHHSFVKEKNDAVDVHVSPTKKLPLHRIVGGNTLPAQPVQPTPTPTAAPLPLPHPAAPRAIETSAEEGTRPHESAAPVHTAPEQAIQGGLEVNLAEVEDISMETASETTPIPNSIAEVSPSTTTTSIPLPPSTFQPFPLAESTFAPFPVADSTFVPVPTPAATFAPLPTPSVTLAPFPQPALSLKEEEKKEEAVFPVPAQMENEYEEEEEEEETDDSDVAPSTEQTTSPSTSPSTTASTTTASTTTIVPLPVLPDGAGRQPVPSAPVGIAAITEELPAVVADPTAVCGLSAEAGPCFDYSPRWYYNPANSRCEQFSYGGCGGNGNNFAERKTCEVRCAASGSAPSLLSQVPERCTLPKDIGTGGGFASKWFFSMQSLRCEQFVFEGVGGNSNQFDSLSDCERLCTPADDGANKELSEEDEEDYDGVEGEEPNFGSDDASPPKSAIPPPLTSVDDSTDLTEKTPEVAPAVHGSKTVQKNYHTDPIRSVVDVNGEELPIVAPSPPETVNYQTGHRAAGIRTFAESNGRVAIENAESVDDEEEAPAAHPALPSCPNSAPELKYADGRPVMCLPGKNQCPDKSVCYFNGLDYFCCPEDEDPYDKHVFGGYNGEETKQGYKRFGHLNIRRLRDSVIDHSRRKRDAVEARLFSVDPLRFDGAPIKQISSARSAKSIRRHPGNKRKTACDYPLEKGECAEQHLRFFYDKASDSCRLFHYSGCNGNANNFGSIGDCQEKCVKGMKDTAAQQQKMASALPPGTCPSGEPLGGSAPVLCGNTTESIGCPKGYFCRQGPPDVCCPNLSLNEILAASSSAEVPVKETEQTTVPTPSTTTTKAPQHYCPDASDPLLTKAGKIRTCGSGFDGLKMCPKGFYCAINADQNTRLCCPILGSSSRIPYQHGVIPPYFGKRNPNSGELIGRGSLPADQKTAPVDEESTEMDKKAMDDFIVPKSPKGSSLERFIDEAEVKSEEEEDEDMARMMLKPTKHQEEQKEVADIILPSIEAENSPVMISNVPTPVLESETTVPSKETFDRSRCQMRPDEGRPCREDEVAPRTNLHYFYSEVDGRCKLYFYKGCGGNENRFERKADCQTTCMA